MWKLGWSRRAQPALEAAVWDGWLRGALWAPHLLGWWEPTAEEGLPPTQL